MKTEFWKMIFILKNKENMFDWVNKKNFLEQVKQKTYLKVFFVFN